MRDADVLGVWSPNRKNAASAAEMARTLDVGSAKAYASITDMVADPAIDAIWLTGPNQARIENVEEIVARDREREGNAQGHRVREAAGAKRGRGKRVAELVKRAGISHGYLENQVFAPQVEVGRELLWARGAATTGRPYLARAAEEHSGPHVPWFWQGELQGGGVLNDMMCHSALVVRHLLTKPGRPRVDGASDAHHGAHREPQVDATRVRQAAREDVSARKSITRSVRPRISPARRSSSRRTMGTP